MKMDKEKSTEMLENELQLGDGAHDVETFGETESKPQIDLYHHRLNSTPTILESKGVDYISYDRGQRIQIIHGRLFAEYYPGTDKWQISDESEGILRQGFELLKLLSTLEREFPAETVVADIDGDGMAHIDMTKNGPNTQFDITGAEQIKVHMTTPEVNADMKVYVTENTPHDGRMVDIYSCGSIGCDWEGPIYDPFDPKGGSYSHSYNVELCPKCGRSNEDDSSNVWHRYKDRIELSSWLEIIEVYEILSGERDPNGIDQHAPGAKLDAGKNRLALVMGGFPRALEAVGTVGTYGASKYSPNGWQHVTNGEERYSDAMMRHLMAHWRGEIIDPESGLEHLAQVAWNTLAWLELEQREAECESDDE